MLEQVNTPATGAQGSVNPSEVVAATPTSILGTSRLCTFRELVNAYMAVYTGRDCTRASRLSFWLARFGDCPLTDVSDDHIFDALADLAKEPALAFKGRARDGAMILRPKASLRSHATVNRYHAALGALFKWAVANRRVPKGWENPIGRVPRRREDNAIVRYLDERERRRLLDACRRSDWPKLYLLVLLALTTGARRGTLLALRWRDIRWSRNVAEIGRTKNGDPITLVLLPRVLEELSRFRTSPDGRKPHPDELIFASRLHPRQKPYELTRPWKAALRAAKVKDFRFHDLRHSCASYAAQSGASLLEIADLLGHRTMAMVKRYSHLSTDSKAKLVGRVFGDIE